MAKKQSKRQRDIKTKLMAAICMLLVSSIMMVSSTYAWFTLSTAPEVTGINTAVGANGNLEMALLPVGGIAQGVANQYGVTSNSNDSTKPLVERNVTWGNLVDVSDASYGLDNIVLYPSELVIDKTSGNISSAAFLSRPVYGADGRIESLASDTSTGKYDTAKDAFFASEDTGVRGIGVASGMTDRQLSYRNAKAAGNDARKNARELARMALTDNGSALASVAVKKATGDENFTKADLEKLNGMLEDLAAEGGVLDQMETAYIQYLLAFAASSATGTNDSLWSTVKAEVEKENATIDSVLAKVNEIIATVNQTATTQISLPTQLTAGIAAYKQTKADVDNAVDEYEKQIALNKEIYTWGDISDIVTYLADPNQMLVNDIEASKVMQNTQKIIDDVTGGKGIWVTVVSGAGIFADVADQCGDYEAGVRITGVDFSGFDLNTNATMKTKSTVTPPYLTILGTAVEAAKAPSAGDTTVNPMTDMYGYIIDMVFRTNASDSNLLLQAEGVDRIYEGSTGVEIEDENGQVIGSTMGQGATMTFKSTTVAFGDAQVKNLMRAIRIVFFNPDPSSLEIIAYAKLDVDNAKLTEDGWTAQMYIYEITGETSEYVTATGAEATHKENVSYEEATDGEYVQDGADSYRLATEDDDAQATRYKKVVTYTEVSDGTGTHKLVVTPAGERKVENNKIMALNQNQATLLSCLVYLDGNVVTNADVAATGSTSMVGKMNLQFSSSAELTPMNYTPLQNQGGTETTPETTVPETTVPETTAPQG